MHNMHLFPLWLNDLERKIENLKQPDIHPEFRMFMTTASSKNFPASVLKESIKITVESSVDAKQTMLNAYQNITDEYVDACKRSGEFRKLLFGLTLFHALLIERKRFGPIGWNNGESYDFSNEDLAVTMDQLHDMMMNHDSNIEFKVLQYNTAVIN